MSFLYGNNIIGSRFHNIFTSNATQLAKLGNTIVIISQKPHKIDQNVTKF